MSPFALLLSIGDIYQPIGIIPFTSVATCCR
nr:MAG TPA: hypothetical protein [Caudoviricetes sp.]